MSLAGAIQRLVAQTSSVRNGPADATRTLKACDAGNEVTWSPALLTRPAYDATGRRVLIDPSGNQFLARRLWVRATAKVRGVTRAVASMVQVSETSAFPLGYGILAGKLAFLNGVNAVTDCVLGDKAALGTLTNALLGTTPTVTGHIGVRCGLLSDLCVDAVASTLTGIPLLTDTALANGEITQFGSPTTVPANTVRLLRERSVRAGTYDSQIANGAPCIPAGLTPTATSVLFIETVGDGKGTCQLPVSSARAVGTIIVGSGRVNVTAPTTTSTTAVTGVIYGLNNQNDRLAPVVTINSGAKVIGGVYADGGGVVAIHPPSFSLTDTLCKSILGPVLCLLTPVTGLLDALLRAGGVNQLLTMLLPHLSTYGPAVQYDAATVGANTVFGSSGAVQGTFRQVPAGA